MIINPYRFTGAGLGTQWDGYGQNSASADGVNDHIDCGSDSSIDNIFDGGGTAACWVKIASDGGSNTGRILDKRDTGNGWFILTLNESGGECDIRFSMDWSTTDYRIITTNSITLNAWHHIALTYNSDSTANNATLYIDGSSVAYTQEVSSAGIRLSDASEPFIMCNRDSFNRNFDGSICDVRLYNSELSSGTISNLANGYHHATDLVSWWKLLNVNVPTLNISGFEDAVGTSDGTGSLISIDTDGPHD
jgi:hypothetical protein